ncbi:hypothetical protein GBN18_04070 [Plesiomonas shigelloides]|nr:hypothetical protein GBN18_04070 [Plesiomonas shigelloides]
MDSHTTASKHDMYVYPVSVSIRCGRILVILTRKRVVAYTFGPQNRNDEICRCLLSLRSPFQIRFITSDSGD